MFLSPQQIEQIEGKTYKNPLSYQNCGGFAMGVMTWYMPAANTCEEIFELYNTAIRTGNWEHLEELCVKNILRDFPNVQLISKSVIDNLEMMDFENHTLIAFRIKRDWCCDFHFVKTDSEGNWLEKCGHDLTVYKYRYEEIYECWGKYDGTLYFFVK